MGRLGMMEIVIIGGLALLIFGPSQLPRLGKSIADTIRSFKQAGKELTGEIEQEVRR
jgi:sec-independent protein translocase protein TatA